VAAAGGTQTLSLYKLNEGPSSVFDTNTNNPLDYVRVAETRSGGAGAFQVFGVQTAAADMYRSGTLSYDGEAVGQFFEPTTYPNGRQFVANALVQVDFGKPSNQVFVQISNAKYQDQINIPFPDDLPPQPGFNGARYTAQISGATFSGATDTAGYTGAVQGAFYGPGTAPADEVGGTFNMTNIADPRIKAVGAFAAGR
jgi:hypothetical protein